MFIEFKQAHDKVTRREIFHDQPNMIINVKLIR